MICTTLETLEQYSPLNPRFPETFRALRALAAAPFAPGRHEVDGDAIFINAAEYETRPAAMSLMEAHRRYIDIMLLLSGTEIIGVQPVDTLQTVVREFDAAADILQARLDSGYSALSKRPGSVAILFPEDAHAPAMDAGATAHVQKLIAKVLV